MKEFNQPNLNAPRFRPKKCNILNTKLYNKFIEKNPKYKHITIEQFKEVIKKYNGSIWNEVIENRDGVELPEQLGNIFIGTCYRKKSDNVDYKKSVFYGKKIQSRNWESDEFVAKIFYTNYENKYKFKFHEFWGFTGVRDFKRTVAHTYPTEWKKYRVVDNMQKVSKLFRRHTYRQYMESKTTKQLEHYNEFDLD